MRVLLSCILIVVYCFTCKGQRVGLKANVLFSDLMEINHAYGPGLFINIADTSCRLETLIFVDRFSKIYEYDSCAECMNTDTRTSYRNFSLSVSEIYRKDLTTKLKFKLGPVISYHYTDAERGGIVANWIESFKSHYIGTGILFNFQIDRFLLHRLSLELFTSPSYLFNIKNRSEQYSLHSELQYNLFIVPVHLGLSYKLM